MATVKVEFNTDEAAYAFMSWMDGSGEQFFPNWAEEMGIDMPMPKYDNVNNVIKYDEVLTLLDEEDEEYEEDE